MPSLNWNTKTAPEIPEYEFIHDSIVFPQGNGYPHGAVKNKLYLGDNLQVMASLLDKFENKIDLIYADPPFFSNKHYPARVGRGEDSRQPKNWKKVAGYPDQWSGLEAYLDFLYPRLVIMVRLLAPHGTLYLHLDWHADAYARLLLDELMGRDNLLNEIIWIYHGPSPIRSAFNRKHDVILAYTKSKEYTFNVDAVREPYHPNTLKTFASSSKAGFGKVPNLERGKVPEDWWYFPVVARLHDERTGYPTQKPEALLERILLASSNEGDLVADFFCGSGSFPKVAARNKRNFIAADASWQAIHTTRKRLSQATISPFSLWKEKAAVIPVEKGEISFNISENSITINDAPPLDYWELDPAWNGSQFFSACQVCRTNRSNLVLPVHQLKIKQPAGNNMAFLRAVTVDGKLLVSDVQPVSHPPDGSQ